jgi:uncharacterized RDD family membrane protein YckC
MFPKGVEKCADTLAHRPGLTILTGVLGVIAVPIIWILLAITVVGIFVVPIAVFCTVLYGRAAINYLIGRPLVGKISPPALATLLGGLIICLFYLIPFVGFLVVALLNFLGFAAGITTMLAPAREAVAVRPAPVAPVVAPVAPPPAQGLEVPAAAAAVAPVIPVMVEPPVIPASVEPPAFVPPVVPPPVIPPVIPVAPAGIPPVAAAVALPGAEYLLPRASFWIRMTALLIDLVIVAIVAHGSGAFCLVALAGYAAIMWKYKGTTLGGIILGLKVVRVDGRPVDWPTAIVRALACFISLFVAGLGFIWIAIDPDRQGWHDRIAGTVVVRLPKAQPLV